jgi:glycosyltransferase involved in cell wall biosynthesis
LVKLTQMDAITICAANYLPFAEVLGNSFLDTNPESTFSILVIDSKRTKFDKNKRFHYLTPENLDIPKNVFENMAFYYNVTELATALKPSALKALFANGSEKVVYLDPDIQVFDELSELNQALENNSIVLTPHTLTPIPRDGLRPTEADIMGSGTFNLGFIALAKSQVAIDMLNWWEERLRFDSISDPEEMLFTDQRWIDFVPSYYPMHVLRVPGYNVAYWNLQERELTGNVNEVKVNGSDLKFFHFSGYRPETPWILSKYVSDNPRVVVSQNSLLAHLCDQYGSKAKQNGWKSESAIEYGYANFENGKFIPSSLRRLYRANCISAFNEGTTLTPPDNWQNWATKRTVQSGNLSQILFSIWKSRPDLKRRYPDATGTEAQDLLQWASTHGVAEKVIDKDLLSIGDLSSDSYPTKKTSKKGINVAGYLQGELGLGQSARLIHQSALSTGLPVTTLNSNRSLSRQAEKVDSTNSDVIYPLTVAIVNADHFKFWVDDIGPERIKHSTIIGVWAWEIEDFPAQMHNAFELVDEIWAVSNFVKNAISKHTKKPIYVIPTPIFAPAVIEKLDRSLIGIRDQAQYNLFIFDYMSVFNRKNPLALVEAHKKAFPNSDGPLLVIKSANGDKDAENREKLRFSVLNRSDILLVEEYLSRNQLNALVAECQSYISLHRSEGYGLTIAEAMALGKPVIATAYSGNLDFMTEENSILIPFNLVKVGNASFPYPEDSNWAEPDIESASIAIRNLAFDNQLKVSLGKSAQETVTRNFSQKRAADYINQRATFHYSKRAKIKRRINSVFLYILKIINLVISILRSPKKIKKILG